MRRCYERQIHNVTKYVNHYTCVKSHLRRDYYRNSIDLYTCRYREVTTILYYHMLRLKYDVNFFRLFDFRQYSIIPSTGNVACILSVSC